MLKLHDGLNAVSQNRWPSLKTDFGAINDRLGMFFPAGFYNKTFMWPRSFWDKLYEPVDPPDGRVRRRADRGRSGHLRRNLCALRPADCWRGPSGY